MRTAAITSLVALALSGACQQGMEDPAKESQYSEYVTEIIYASDLLAESSGQAGVIDLTQGDAGYVIEDGVDLSRFTLVCPNGQIMNLASWVGEQSSTFDIEYAQRPEGFFLMKALEDTATQSPWSVLREPAPCPPECHLCSDGACLC